MAEEKKDLYAEDRFSTFVDSGIRALFLCGAVGVTAAVGGLVFGGTALGMTVGACVGGCIFGKGIVKRGYESISAARDYYRRKDPGVFDRNHTLERERGYDGKPLHPSRSSKLFKALGSCGRVAAWTLGTAAAAGFGILVGAYGIPFAIGAVCAYKAARNFPAAKKDYLEWKNHTPVKEEKKERSPLTVKATKMESAKRIASYTAAFGLSSLGIAMAANYALLGGTLSAIVATAGIVGGAVYFGPAIYAHAKNIINQLKNPPQDTVQNQQTNQRTNQQTNQQVNQQVNQQTNQQVKPNLRGRLDQQQRTVQRANPNARVTVPPQPRKTPPKPQKDTSNLVLTVKGMGGR